MRIGILSLLCFTLCLGCRQQDRALSSPETPVLRQSGAFSVSVDYSLPIELIVAKGFKTDDLPLKNADLFSDRHFPRDDTGTADLRMRIVSFENGGRMTLKEQFLVLDRNGLRPATLPELLAFVAKHPCLVIPGYLVAADFAPLATSKELGKVALTPYAPMNGCRFDDEDANRPKPGLSVILRPFPSEAYSGFIPVFYLLAVEKTVR